MTEQAQAATAIAISLVFVILCIVAAFFCSLRYFAHTAQAGNLSILVSLVAAFLSMALSYFVYRIVLRVLRRISGPAA
jgi:uncharacterized membrane protein required for colicin V production